MISIYKTKLINYKMESGCILEHRFGYMLIQGFRRNGRTYLNMGILELPKEVTQDVRAGEP